MIFHYHDIVSSVSHISFCKTQCRSFKLLTESTVHVNDPMLDLLHHRRYQALLGGWCFILCNLLRTMSPVICRYKELVQIIGAMRILNYIAVVATCGKLLAISKQKTHWSESNQPPEKIKAAQLGKKTDSFNLLFTQINYVHVCMTGDSYI